MRKFDNIILSETAPNTRSLWLKGNELLIFSKGTWRPLPIKVQGGDSSEDLPGGASKYVTMDYLNLGEINFNDFDTDRKLIVEVTDSVTVHNFKKASNVTLELHTDIGVFDVICTLENISMARRLFLSPKIYADGENETTLRVAANIFTNKITFEITETTV